MAWVDVCVCVCVSVYAACFSCGPIAESCVAWMSRELKHLTYPRVMQECFMQDQLHKTDTVDGKKIQTTTWDV